MGLLCPTRLLRFSGPSSRISARADALQAAAAKNDTDGIRFLLRDGISVNACDTIGKTALHAAAHAGAADAVAELIKAGADVCVKDTVGGDTPLTLACRQAHVGVVKTLLQNGANIKDKHATGETLLRLAYLAGRTYSVDPFKVRSMNGLHLQTPGNLPCRYIVNENYFELAECLLLHGANVNAKEEQEDYLIIAAAKEGLNEYVDLFIRHHADLSVVDEHGWTALHFAIHIHHYKMEKLLRAGGAVITEEKTRLLRLDGFNVVSVLGTGSFGKVFKVQDPATGEKFALKQIMCETDDDLRNAQAEVEMLKQANHPGIVKYHRSYTAESADGDQHFCVVMELCTSGTLQTYTLS
ncbi:hypothetical protein DIPPA_22644a, partial [Diplonema papillatum]